MVELSLCVWVVAVTPFGIVPVSIDAGTEVIFATPLVAIEVPLTETPVIVPILEVLLFQFWISLEVIPAAALALNTGSVSSAVVI